MSEYPADRLKHMALVWLREQYPDAMLTTEFTLSNWGAARVDVAAITDAEIIGVEIKGDGDSPARLERQAITYPLVAQRMWLLSAPSLFERCLKKWPTGWGILRVDGDRVGVGEKDWEDQSWSVLHGPLKDPSDPESGYVARCLRNQNSAAAMAGCIWADAAKLVWRRHLEHRHRHKLGVDHQTMAARTGGECQKRMAEFMSAAELRPELVEHIRTRKGHWHGQSNHIYAPGEPVEVST